MNYYGLRQARNMVKKTSAIVKGENDTYAKGWRDACKHIYADISNELARLKAEAENHIKPPPPQ